MDIKLFINNKSPGSPKEHLKIICRMKRITAKAKVLAMKFLKSTLTLLLNFNIMSKNFLEDIQGIVYTYREITLLKKS